MKRMPLFLFVLMLVFTAVGCGRSGKADEGFKIAYISKESRSSFHAILNGTATKGLDQLKADGKIADWRFYDGLEDPLVQNDLLENAINDGADLVILLPAEEDGSAPIVAKCAELNIPCIVVNSKTSNTDQLSTAYITSNDVEAGEMMAKFVQEQFPNGGAYAHIQGVLGNSAQVQRSQGIHNIIDTDSKWAMLDEQSANWDPARGVQYAEDWLNLYGTRLDTIICEDDDTSAAVQNAMNAAGRTDIVCIGVNGNATACTMISNNTMLATIYQDGAGQINGALKIAEAIATGQSYTGGTIIIPYVLITKANVAQYL
jgi:ABC-type sugar transport system substrate-binding protein